jgi:hypothetical protein
MGGNERRLEMREEREEDELTGMNVDSVPSALFHPTVAVRVSNGS